MTDDDHRRTLEYALELAASPEDVWEAIATPQGLKNWFSYDARVRPGKGGTIWLSWGDFDGEAPISIWDPPNHLQQSEHRAPYGDPSQPPADIAVDFFIAAGEGTTTLRLVHSGMGPEAAWDGEYHATAEDWPWFLANLTHYLHWHRGASREILHLAVPFEMTAAELWARLLGGKSSVGEGSGHLREGAHYDLSLFGLEPIGGEVKILNPGRRFMGTIEGLNRAMLVMTVSGKGTSSRLALELSTWGLSPDGQRETCRAWREALRGMGGQLEEEAQNA